MGHAAGTFFSGESEVHTLANRHPFQGDLDQLVLLPGCEELLPRRSIGALFGLLLYVLVGHIEDLCPHQAILLPEYVLENKAIRYIWMHAHKLRE